MTATTWIRSSLAVLALFSVSELALAQGGRQGGGRQGGRGPGGMNGARQQIGGQQGNANRLGINNRQAANQQAANQQGGRQQGRNQQQGMPSIEQMAQMMILNHDADRDGSLNAMELQTALGMLRQMMMGQRQNQGAIGNQNMMAGNAQANQMQRAGQPGANAAQRAIRGRGQAGGGQRRGARGQR